MKIIQGTKRILKPLVDFPTWMGYRTLVDSGKVVLKTTKRIFTPATAQRTETFEQAMSRLNLSQKDIQLRQKLFFWLTLLWLIIAIASLTHAISLCLKGGFSGGILALALASLAATLAFRQHFWYLQAKHQVLGMDFTQWLNLILGKKK
jgi:hypothetical protein